eukprot:193890-Amphidinium_carterae.1
MGPKDHAHRGPRPTKRQKTCGLLEVVPPVMLHSLVENIANEFGHSLADFEVSPDGTRAPLVQLASIY